MAWRNPFRRGFDGVSDNPRADNTWGARAMRAMWLGGASASLLRIRAGARHACARLRGTLANYRDVLDAVIDERDTALRNLSALEWLALRGYPCGRSGDGSVSCYYSEDGDPEWFATWAECARAAGWTDSGGDNGE